MIATAYQSVDALRVENTRLNAELCDAEGKLADADEDHAWLISENARLRAENARLRGELEAAKCGGFAP